MKSVDFLTLIVIGFLFGGFASLTSAADPHGSTMDSLFIMPDDDIQTRWASAENWKGEKGVAAQANAGRKGSPNFPLGPGESKVLAEVSGHSGTVRRIWTTINIRSAKMLRGIKIEMFWDGADKPAVSAPLGDFYGHGLGRMATFQNALFSSPEGRSFNTCVPMPFKTGMKIVVTNETDQHLPMFFYDVNYTLNDDHPDEMMYFHSYFRRENPTTLKQDYVLLPKVTGRGRYLGVLIGADADTEKYGKSWWGEGEVKVYLDGDEEFPTLAGTGTEDYIGTGWGQGQYAQLYQGCPIADGEAFQYVFYRLHVPDPVYFHQDIHVTIQQIGYYTDAHHEAFKESGVTLYRTGPGLEEIDLEKQPGGLFERQDDWSSCAYFYLDRPTNNLPPLMPYEQRVAGLLDE